MIKATKRFRTVTLLMSLGMSIASIAMLCVPAEDCSTGNLKFAVGCITVVWCVIFVVLLMQSIGLVSCLKKWGPVLFVFYFVICGVMYISQLMIWGGEENNCRKDTPTMYWFIVTNVIMFYVIVSFGLATWGTYLCKVADAYEELTKEAVDELMAERKQNQGQLMITAGMAGTNQLAIEPQNQKELLLVQSQQPLGPRGPTVTKETHYTYAPPQQPYYGQPQPMMQPQYQQQTTLAITAGPQMMPQNTTAIAIAPVDQLD